MCEPASGAAGGAGAREKFGRGRYRCASSGRGAFGWERRVQRVPASGSRSQYPTTRFSELRRAALAV